MKPVLSNGLRLVGEFQSFRTFQLVTVFVSLMRWGTVSVTALDEINEDGEVENFKSAQTMKPLIRELFLWTTISRKQLMATN